MFSISFFKRRTSTKNGFTLIELAIVLGVVGVLSAGLWKIMSTGTQQTKDQATAQLQQSLINAVTGFLASSGGNTLLTNAASYAQIPIFLPPSSVGTCPSQMTGNLAPWAGICDFLPVGFNATTTNPYGQTFVIMALKDGNGTGTPPQTYSFMIATQGAPIPDSDGGRISSLIGGDGGFIYTNPVCTAATSPTTACGSMGAWTAITSTFGFGSTMPPVYNSAVIPSTLSGEIASRTFIAGISGSNLWLARVAIPGDTTFSYNTVQNPANIFMGVTTGSSNLYMYQTDSVTGLPSPSGANNIYINNGALYIQGCNDGTTSCPGGDGNGSIQLNNSHAAIELNNGQISGNGSGLSGRPQIELTVPTAAQSFYNISQTPLIQLTAGCTGQSESGSTYSPSACPAALNIIHGDINVGGVILAIKVYSTSDARLKTNIHPIEDPLENLMKIAAVAFSYKSGGPDSMGVTAQDLEKTYPQLVLTKDGTKYVDYSGLMGPLIGAVQELKRQNDDLREQLSAEKARQDRIEKTLIRTPARP